MPGPDARQAPTGARIAWIDNLRWAVIAMVVLMHACVTYSGQGSWFFMEKMNQDVASTLVFGIFQSFGQAFSMGLMFFLAGTLVPAGYDRKGFLRFVADRAVRLGVPSLAFMLILNPLIGLIRRAAAGEGVDWEVFFAGYRDFLLSGTGHLFDGGLNWQAAAIAAWEAFFCVGFSLGLLTLCRERVNVSNRLTGLLKSTGFGVYTFHAPILVGISILLLPLAIHTLAKALL